MHSAMPRQRGVTLIGLLFWAVLIAFGGVLTARVFPSVLEYFTIEKAVNKIAQGNPATVPAARAEFERIKQVEYSIQSISGQDLVITKENDRVKIRFAYDKLIDVAGPVFLLIKYEGESR